LKNIIKVSLALLHFVISCKTTDSNVVENNDKISPIVEELAKDKFGDDFNIFFNLKNDYVLCTSSPKTEIPNSREVSYFIFDIIGNMLVEEKIIRNGSISWISDYEIKVTEIPGMIKKNENGEMGYILNLKNNSKTKLNGGVNWLLTKLKYPFQL